VNPLTAWLNFASWVGYGFIYTLWLKRATPQNIVIGGLFGAAPPLFGWAAITGTVEPGALLLVLIIFAWTPPHFWPLAIARKDEYEDIAMPMLPVTHGEQYTKWHIFFYTLIMIATSLLPFAIGMSGWLYLAAAIALGARVPVLVRGAVARSPSPGGNGNLPLLHPLFDAAVCSAAGGSLPFAPVRGRGPADAMGVWSMSSGIRNTLLGCFAFMALMLGLFTNNMFREPVLSDAELREKGIVLLPQPRQVAPFALVGDDGQPFTEADLAGGWTLAYFGFTSCPDICPVALSVLAEGRRRLEAEGAPDFRGLLVSVDPERDTPERLQEYVQPL
jgi:hypothetical protein